MSRKPTLRDLAEATGLSVSTVSRALSGSPRISAATRARVEQEARRQGYERDLAASLLRRRDVRHVGLVCRLDQELHFAYRSELLARAESAGLRLVVQSVDSGWSLEQSLSDLRQMRCRALVVIDPGSYAGLDLAALDVPAVLIGQGPFDGTTDLVTSDNAHGMEQVVAHLGAQGVTEAVYLDGPAGRSATVRRDAFVGAASRAGLEVRVVPAGADADSGYDAVLALKREGRLPGRRGLAGCQVQGPRPVARGVGPAGSGPGQGPVQALVCYNDQCAQGAVMGLARFCLRPGRDVAVTGCDDSRIARSIAFDLTSISRRIDEVAAAVTELVVSRLERPEREAVHRMVATELVVRGSSLRS